MNYLAETSNRVAVVFDANLSACLNGTSSGVACVDPGTPAWCVPSTAEAIGVLAWDSDSSGDVPWCCTGRAALLSVLQGLVAAGGQGLFAG